MVITAVEEAQRTPDGLGSERTVYPEVFFNLICRPQTSMDDNIFDYRPTGDQEGIWEAGTGLPFDPFASSAILTDSDIECPRCEQRVGIRGSSSEFGKSWTILNLIYFSVCETRRNRICSSGFRNGVPAL
jgi:hypothetical protein